MTPPRDLADAQARLDRIRDYAKSLRRAAEILRADGLDADLHDSVATALERIIGGEQ